MRNSTRGKGLEEGGSAYAKVGLSLRRPPVPEHLPPKPESACNVKTWIRSLGWEDPLEKKMASHSSILAWKIPWTEVPGRLQVMGS